MENIKNFIFQQVATNKLTKDEAKVLLKELYQSNVKEEQNSSHDIAIVGMACKLPGAENTEAYWSILEKGVRTMGEFPFNRRRDTDPFVSGGAEYRKGGYLDQIDRFDAPFFRISRREAEAMDPMQRLFLETAWEAMEDSGIGSEKLKDTKTAVYVGQETNYNNEYRKLLAEEDELSMTGSHTGIIASRIQYLLNLRGPSLVLDTACSSSLVALHLACQGLRNNEFDYALVGGISAFLFPAGQSLVMESGSAEIRAFDKNASGTCWSEGFGVVMLKPLDKALQDQDHIHAVIKGSAMNNDGTSNGITAPNADSQAEVLTAAWESAGIPPESISYIETHGTGTPLGDPIEIKGLTKAFRRYTKKRQFCGIGSVKTNIGHAVATSGIASLMKVVLAMQHQKLPQTLSFQAPNPYIHFADSPVYVNDCLRDWETGDTPRRAGVSAFGFSGTNVHVVLEEAPARPARVQTERGSELFVVSARTENALRSLLTSYSDYLRENPHVSLADLCYTASTGRKHYTIRLAFFVHTTEELLNKLQTALAGELEDIPQIIPHSFFGKHKIIFHKQEKQAGELTEQDVVGLSDGINGRLAELTASGITERSAEDISRAYVLGADVDWNIIYKQSACQLLRVPTYPFDRIRYWASGEHLLQQNDAVKQLINAPLLDYCISRTPNESVYETNLSVDKEWVLSEHVIGGQAVLPGTAYLEIALEAGEQYLGKMPGGIEDIQFLSPFVVDSTETKTLYTVIREEDQRLYFTIGNAKGSLDEEEGTVHAVGELMRADVALAESYDLVELISKFSKTITPDVLKAETSSDRSIVFGRRFQNIDRLYVGEQEALVELNLSSEFAAETNTYWLHPALLDKATGAVSDLLAEDDDLFLAFAYKRLRIVKRLPEKLFSYVKRLSSSSKELLTYQVTIMDTNGNVLVEIDKFTVKKLNRKAQNLLNQGELASSSFFYEVGWREMEQPQWDTTDSLETICVLKNPNAFTNKLLDKLLSEGHSVLQVDVGDEYVCIDDEHYVVSGSEEDYMRLLSAVQHIPFTKLIHFPAWGESQAADFDELQSREKSGVYDLYRLVRALVKSKRPEKTEVILVADNASEVTSCETTIKPINAALFGLGKVVEAEHSFLSCRSIDLDEMTSIEELYRELQSKDHPYAVAYREGKRYAEEIRPLSLVIEDRQPVELQKEGVYVLSGGTGGLSLEIARWLSTCNKVKLVLLHRSPFPERSRWEQLLLSEETDAKLLDKLRILLEIEENGSQIIFVEADVTQRELLKEALDVVRRQHGAIKGIIHSAGVAGDGFLIRKEEETFRNVIAPKVEGAWLLDELTREDKPDFFVLFSSVTSILGGPGQGDYTAANAFLDSFAAYRTKRGGGTTLTINWPAWKETGMAKDYEVNQDGIFKALSTADALLGFETALTSSISKIIIGELNYDVIQTEEQAPLQLSEEIKIEIKRRALKRKRVLHVNEKAHISIPVVLEGRSSGIYSEKEQQLSTIWGEVLGVERMSIQDSFYDLGGDSLLAIKISNLIEKKIGQKVDIGDLFEYLTIFELAQALGGEAPESTDAVSLEADESLRIKSTREFVFDLSNAQQRIWFLHKLNPELHAYHLPLTFETDFELDQKTFEAALMYMTARHSSLRTVIREEDGEPIQIVLPHIDLQLVWQDSLSTVYESNGYDEELREEIERSFDFSQCLWRIKVIRKNDGRCLICLTVHHLISDGWSMMILKDELLHVYASLLAGGHPELPPLQAEYRDWLKQLQVRKKSEAFYQMERFWLEELSSPLPVLQLPLDYSRPTMQTYNGSYLVFEMDEEQTGRIKELARQNKASMHMFMLSAYFLFLKKLTHQDEFIIGYPVAGRESKEWEPLLGLFMNIVCMRISLSEDWTFESLVAEVRRKSSQSYKNSSYPFDLLVSKLNPERDMSRNPIFQTFFQFYENYQQNEHNSLYDLSFLCREANHKLEIRLEYNTDLFDKTTVERFARQFQFMLGDIATDIQRPLAEFNLHNEQDEAELLKQFSSTCSDVIPDRTVVEWFEQTVARQSEAIAITCGAESFTYSELEQRSNQIAHLLASTGLKANQPVGLMLDRGVPLIAGMIGILKAGGAYVPLDPDYPKERISYMLSHSEARVLLTETKYVDTIVDLLEPGSTLSTIVDVKGRESFQRAGIGHIIHLKNVESQSDKPLPVQADLDDLMYLIYTSGSTGQPKGVAVSHRNVANFLQWSIADGKIGSDDRMVLLTSVSFDISVFEIFGALLSGATLHIVTKEQLQNPEAIFSLLCEKKITLWHSVPALMRQLLVYMRQLTDSKKQMGSAHIRRIMLGGEAWNTEVAEEIRNIFPQTELLNMYGPTETTIWVSSSRIEDSLSYRGDLPIGRPIANTQLLILDTNGRLCPVGIPGEIAIGGLNVAQGYYKDLEKSDKSFVFYGATKERIYLTGDTGMYLSSGEVRFLGRNDGMIKVRGYRIETGEIESVLLRNHSIAEAAVIARPEAGTHHLVCYYVSDAGQITEQLREQLRQSLPEYMLPAHYVLLDKLPKTANGKTDRKQLAMRSLQETLATPNHYVEPITEVEQQLGAIWCELLGIGQVGIHNNFFEVGGNSFLISQMHYQIEQLYPNRISITDIFSYPTINTIAQRIEGMTMQEEAFDEQENTSDEDLEKELYEMFDEIATGNVSVEDAVKKLL
ncbi:amino acid adenylation domain-containing protein [Paenibacillus kyungheensis]|uniref:Amino acid adenylation domain-containing protein n=1 Tax=Paenibacillus kyungheensis TaxID=1452732 RepID=A0AAX3M6W4_9BACL|nr:type I polyketide synthase [Paenibacillus kyungheensis]WCT58029.1 amino acid adenylation domain-containing protein [Paenibacillus kyungheensis]